MLCCAPLLLCLLANKKHIVLNEWNMVDFFDHFCNSLPPPPAFFATPLVTLTELSTCSILVEFQHHYQLCDVINIDYDIA